MILQLHHDDHETIATTTNTKTATTGALRQPGDHHENIKKTPGDQLKKNLETKRDHQQTGRTPRHCFPQVLADSGPPPQGLPPNTGTFQIRERGRSAGTFQGLGQIMAKWQDAGGHPKSIPQAADAIQGFQGQGVILEGMHVVADPL